jgi:prepilin-type N-terminal cleavage/methylation domain-containing protein
MTSRNFHRVRSGDEGFTLPELLISIALVGLITAAVASALMVSFRSQDASSASLAESHDQQQLAVYLPKDIESSVQDSVDKQPTAGSGCTGVPIGTNVLRLTSVDASSGTVVSYAVSYRIEGSAAPYQLYRYACVAGGAATRTKMVDFLPNNTSAAQAGSDTSRIWMTVVSQQSATGLPFTITGTPRTKTLGGGANGGTSCTFSSGILSSPSVGLSGTSLTGPVIVNVTTSNTCSGLSLRFDTGFGPQVLPMGGAGTAWSATILPGAYQWTPGVKDIIVGGTSNNGKMVLAVGNVCALVGGSGTAAPAQTSLSGTNLATNVTISVNTLGSCGSLSLKFNTGTGADKILGLSGSGVTRSFTIAATTAGYSWTAAPHPFEVIVTSSGASIGSIAFSVLGPCTYVSGAVLPSPLLLATGGNLATSALFTVNTAGGCSAVSLDVQTGNNNGSVKTIVLIQNSPNVWTRAVSPTDYSSWTVGLAKPVTVTGTTTAGASFTIAVQQACVYTGGSVSPASPVVGPSGALTSGAMTVSATTSGPCSTVAMRAVVGTGNNAATDVTVPLTQGPAGTWTGSVPGSVTSWTAGNKTVNIFGPANEPGAFGFTVVPACQYQAGSLTGAGSSGTLTLSAPSPATVAGGAYGISVTTTGSCTTPMTAVLPTATGNVTLTLAENPASSGTWTVPISAATTWTSGSNKTITINGGIAPGTVTFNVVAPLPCTFVSGTMTSTSGDTLSVNLGYTSPSPLAIAPTYGVKVTTAGACSGITVTLPTTPATAAVALAQSAADTWTAAVPTTGIWATGTNKVLSVAGTTTPSAQFLVNAQTLPCTFVSGLSNAASPPVLKLGPGATLNKNLLLTVVTDGACTAITGTLGPSGVPSGSVTFTQGTLGNWTATIAKTSTPWIAGPKTVTLTEPTPTPTPSFTFTVAP